MLAPALALRLLGTACLLGVVGAAPAAADTVVRRTVRDHAIKDAHGRTWRPAGHSFRGGRVRRVARPTFLTGSPQLYTFARVGVRRIRLRLPRRGRYAVTLYLADPGRPPSRRVFDVRAEGKTVRRRVDAFVATDDQRPLHAIFEAVVRDRRLDVRFEPRRGRAVVSAIEATRLGDSAMAPPALLWRDDFDGPAGAPPDPATWRHDTGAGFAHGELQAHTDRPENASLDGHGSLAITARQERYTINGMTQAWTSARLRARRAVRLRRAVVEGRVQFPPGAGLWGAFWFYGREPPPYPYAGELDVAEYSGTLPRVRHSFFHFGRNGADDQLTGRDVLRRPLWRRFHEYAVRTVPGAVEVRFDGRRRVSWTRADVPPGGRWPLDGDFDLILSLAVGGEFVGGPPPSTTRFPATMHVDYVRVRG